MKALTKLVHSSLAICSILVFLLAGCSSSSNKEFRFTFDRQDGETYIQKLSISRERHTGAERAEMEHTLIETRVTCRKSSEGWDIGSRPLNTIMMKNGEEIKSPLFELLSKVTITSKIDNSGSFKQVTGYDSVLDAVKSQYLPEVAENILAGINIDAIEQREAAEWKARVGDFLGREFSIGDKWGHDTTYTLPDGVKISYRVITSFKEKILKNNVTCVLVEQTFDSTGEGQAARKQGQISASVKGYITRIIDPATMKIYAEEAKRVINMHIEMPLSGKVPVEIVETRTYDFEYGR